MKMGLAFPALIGGNLASRRAGPRMRASLAAIVSAKGVTAWPGRAGSLRAF
jgi:hypothetical protein